VQVKLIICSALVVLGGNACFQDKHTVPIVARSPDSRWEARLIEMPEMIDRNFEIRLSDLQQRPPTEVTIFRSPDEGRPPGTERFLWSEDSRFLLLLGKRFVTEGPTRLRTGEDMYLLYDLKTKRLWSNAQQTNLERFTINKIAALDFGESLDILGKPEAQ
jgi:hypothetical protein